MDDVWADDVSLTDASYDREVAERNWNKLQDEHGVVGYKEGISEGKRVSLQQGFDQGYVEGAEIAHQLGRMRGVLSTLIQLYGSPTSQSTTVTTADLEELKALHQQLETLGVEQIFTLGYFKGEKTASGTNAHPAKVSELCNKVASMITRLGWE
ncbi:Protein YAE1 [Gaertneriomyces sp. JEL0708]|nr:Protein YAE1 [Gaertneriomyces sp. JEL0708]